MARTLEEIDRQAFDLAARVGGWTDEELAMPGAEDIVRSTMHYRLAVYSPSTPRRSPTP